MFDEVEAIWLEVNEGGQRCVISCTEVIPVISMEDLN